MWEADEDGFYDVQYADERVAARGHLFADEAGHYRFWAVTPTPYPIPSDGPVGAMLAAVGRSPMRASHLHFMVSAPARRTLVTHIFVDGCEHLGRDSVFGVKDSLVREFAVQEPGTPTPDGRSVGGGSWSRVRFDIVLAPAAQERAPDAHVHAVPEGDQPELPAFSRAGGARTRFPAPGRCPGCGAGAEPMSSGPWPRRPEW